MQIKIQQVWAPGEPLITFAPSIWYLISMQIESPITIEQEELVFARVPKAMKKSCWCVVVRCVWRSRRRRCHRALLKTREATPNSPAESNNTRNSFGQKEIQWHFWCRAWLCIYHWMISDTRLEPADATPDCAFKRESISKCFYQGNLRRVVRVKFLKMRMNICSHWTQFYQLWSTP